MTIFDALTLFGGLAMFLYGMRIMGAALRESSSGTLKNALDSVTNNFFKAFLLGTGLTALIQSSTATIVITSGLVGAGILSVHQSLGIVVGANVGTTVTGQIIRLIDLNTGNGASWLRFFKPSTLAPIALIIGIIFIMGVKAKNSQNIGNIAMGFGILFMGLLTMTDAVDRVSSSPLVESLLRGLGDNPVIGYVTGAGIAFVLQSSSATIGILQAFSASGLLTFKAIYAVIAGVYLGDCVTTAIVCWIGSNRDTKRVGIINIFYNLAKTAFVFISIFIARRFGLIDHLWDATANSGLIANTNTFFNLVCAFALFPIMNILEKIGYKVIPDEKAPENKYQERFDALNTSFADTPAIALRSCYDMLNTAYGLADKNINLAFSLLDGYDEKVHREIMSDEEYIDQMTDRLRKYTVELLPHFHEAEHISILNQYFKVTTEFEHLGDQAVSIAEIARTLYNDSKPFSTAALNELKVLRSVVDEMMNASQRAFEKRDINAAYRIEPLEQVVSEIIERLKLKHLQRMGAGECSVYADAYYMNLLSNVQRIADVCSNIGLATIIRVHPELADQEHSYVDNLHEESFGRYDKEYVASRDKYMGMLNETKTLNREC